MIRWLRITGKRYQIFNAHPSIVGAQVKNALPALPADNLRRALDSHLYVIPNE